MRQMSNTHIIHKDKNTDQGYEHCLGCHCNTEPEPCPTNNPNPKVITDGELAFMEMLDII